ncbi:hypothetical protein [Rhizobium leguminosarum]|uniref:hypothetical protein n=1 Tax=Rhizobium leguminosarum TaxID=384 RepID=UPI001C945550|nr:hypothetical protein [Rhizobium leguminosarum]MBY5808956.1 hypothetical protein [Rhizobium leguminosarum]
MDVTAIDAVLGLASTAVSVTGKAASTAEAIKKLFSSDKAPDAGEALKLVNTLAVELTSANMMNVDLSSALKTLSQELKADDEFVREKDRYDLVETDKGDLVYKLKEDRANGQPIHFICPVCLKRDRLISFIRGEGDYKVCQTEPKHHYQFKHTPLPTRSGGGGGRNGWMGA